MKKNMLLAILLATFFSCTEVLDELNTIGIDPDVVVDSLGNIVDKEDSVIVEDSLINEEDSLDTDEPPVSSLSSGVFYLEQELSIWRERAQYGPYKSEGDAGQNTPGDYRRILENANDFLNNPTSQRYTVNVFPVPQWYKNEPQLNGVKLRDAAFVYLLTGEEKYAQTVKNELVAQAKEPSMDFSDQSKWKDGVLVDINPSFVITEWLLRLLVAYDYTKDEFSQDEKDIVEGWFLDAALFFQRNTDASLDQLYSNRSAGILSSLASKSYDLTHAGGHKAYAPGRWYNNRRTNQIRFSGLTGIMLDHEGLKSSAKRYFKEFIKFAVFPDGITGEFTRSNASRPEAGLFYTFSTVTQLGQIADAFAKNGDTELYDYITSEGALGTAGGNKSLLLVMKTLCKLLDGTMNIYVANTTKTEATKIDGRDDGTIWAHQVWFAQFNQYYKNDYIRNSYQNVLNTSLKIATAGPHQQWGSSGNTVPGVLFMYGQMENSSSY